MCELTILSQNEYGYAAQCSSCNHLQIAFGTSLIRFKMDRLQHFRRYLDDIRNDHLSNEGRASKNIVLDIASVSVFQMILTLTELQSLCNLIEQMEEELMANAMISLFNQ